MELNNIKTNGTWSVIAADLNQNFLKILNELLKYQHITTISGANFLGYFTSSSSLPTTDEAAWAIAGNLKSVTVYAYYTSDALPNGFVEGWNALTSLGTYDFTDYSELLSNIESLNRSIDNMLQDIEHLKSNPNIDIVNNLTDGGSEKALSAEMGKHLNEKIFGDYYKDTEVVTEEDFTEDKCKEIVVGKRLAIWFPVEGLEYSAKIQVVGNMVKYGFHITNNPTVYGDQLVDSGWLTTGASEEYSEKTSNGAYIRIVGTLTSNDTAPSFEEFVQGLSFTLERKINKQTISVNVDEIKGNVKEVKDSVDEIIKLIEPINVSGGWIDFETTVGYGLNGNGVATDQNCELTEYIDVSGYDRVRVVGGFWLSDQASYHSVIELCDKNYSVLSRIVPASLVGIVGQKYCYVYDGEISVIGANYIRFGNFIAIPSSNTNPDFSLVSAKVCVNTEIESLKVYAEQVYDNAFGKNQSVINKEFYDIIKGESESTTETVTQDDLTEDMYKKFSTTRGFFSIPISQYDNFSAKVTVAEDSIVTVGLILKGDTTYGDKILHDSGWLSTGKSYMVSNDTETSSTPNYIGLQIRLSDNSGLPTLEQIQQYINFELVGTVYTANGIVDKIEDLGKKVENNMPMLSVNYDSPLASTRYDGMKIDVSEHEYNWEHYGTISGGSSQAIQGGAAYGRYLFQLHNNLASVEIYDLETREVLQVISQDFSTLNSHANSASFSKTFYEDGDAFPLLYVAHNREELIHVFRITGDEGNYALTLVQTITISLPVKVNYLSATIDTFSNRLLIYGYKGTSWQEATDDCVVCVCDVPSISKETVTITSAYKIFYIPHMYATQDAFARFGKLYMSFGNTGVSSKMGGMIVVDYIHKDVISFVDFKPIGSIEPESLNWYNGNIYMVAISGAIYKLMF